MPKTDDKNPLRFYGRRKGKVIRKGRASAYEGLMPEIEIMLPPSPSPPALRGWERVGVRGAVQQEQNSEAVTLSNHPPHPDPLPPTREERAGGEGEERIDPLSFFAFPARDVWLEIGFGNGEHLAYQAMQNPDVGFIGCEPFVNGVAALCRDIKNNDIKNIRIWPEDARLFMPRLKDKSIGRCFLLNSDPWPKTRHHKRRFVQQETLDELHRLLKPDAEFRMSSDHASLTAWQVEKTYLHGGFSWNAACADDWRKRPADLPETRYQKKGTQHGRDTVFLSFTRK